MRRERRLFASAVMIFVALTLIGCPPKTDEGSGEAAFDTEAWSWLQTAKQELDAARQALSQLRSHQAGKPPAEGEVVPEELAALSPEEIGQRIKDAEAEVLELTDDFGRRLAEFINSQGITVGGELTEVQTQALRMNSDEAIYAAQEFIDKGGDYQRAIAIYNQAAFSDPDNEKLKAAIASAESMRFMTEERFATVKKKMDENAVREALGPVNLQNIKDYPDENNPAKSVKAWFYRKKDDGGAAAVWFKETKPGNGEWLVYKTNFEEVKQKVIGGGSEEDAEGATDNSGS